MCHGGKITDQKHKVKHVNLETQNRSFQDFGALKNLSCQF
jgi:hypothetical protein